MKTIIAGSREILDPLFVDLAVKISGYNITEVVSGTARGPDKSGEWWAQNHNIPITRMPADWDNKGRAAGHIRNADMGNYADQAIILWDGKSRGTKGMIDIMKKLNKPHFVFMVTWRWRNHFGV